LVVIAAIVVDEADDVALAGKRRVVFATASFTGTILRLGWILSAELLVIVTA